MLLLQSVYVFSRLGRGRCAVVGGCVLGRLYGMTYVQVRVGTRRDSPRLWRRCFHVVTVPVVVVIRSLGGNRLVLSL